MRDTTSQDAGRPGGESFRTGAAARAVSPHQRRARQLGRIRTALRIAQYLWLAFYATIGGGFLLIILRAALSH